VSVPSPGAPVARVPRAARRPLPQGERGFGTISSARVKVEALLNPKNIVILGATDRPGNWAQRVWRNLKRYDFPKPIYPFNPNRDAVWERRCYRNFAELPEAPDHLVLLIAAHAVPDALADAARHGARSATIMTSGFDESEDKAAMQAAANLMRVLAETGLAISGPNCLGNLNAAASLMTMPDDRPQRLAAGPAAIVGQSGGIVMAIKRTLEERGVDTGVAVTSGNEMGLTTADYILYFAQRADIKVIVSYLESVRDADAFLSSCREAQAAGKPVVVVKLGASNDGRAAALAHTGRLAGSMEAFDAIAGAAGVIRAKNLDAAVEITEYLVHSPLPRGAGLGAVTFSGGLRGMLLDAAAAHGLRFPPLSEISRRNLQSIVTAGTVIGNPLDAGFAALTSEAAYLRSVEALLADTGVDILLLQEELPRGPGTERKEANLRAVNAIAAQANKPIAFVSMISHGLTDYSRALRAELPNVAFLQEVDKSLATVRALTDHVRRSRPPFFPTGSSHKTKRHLSKLRDRNGPLNEVESKALLKAYGMAASKEVIAQDEREAASLAGKIGFPVVAKAVSAALAHKSDAGAVMLNLNSQSEVRAAFKRIVAAAKREKVPLDGILIAKQATGGIELALGLHRDPEMGMVILFGAGGVQLELHRDVAFAAPPLDEDAAEELISRTRVARLIDGYRGSKPLGRKALVKALIALSQLAMDAGRRIQSVDVNPFLLQRRGGMALDALVVLGVPNPPLEGCRAMGDSGAVADRKSKTRNAFSGRGRRRNS
jgi:acyl-CoA synthetase (NDP forming)